MKSHPHNLRQRNTRVSGFGMMSSADGRIFRPINAMQVAEALSIARSCDRQVVQRGSGRSYGDANIGNECIVLDFCRMNRILDWNPETGIVHVQAGVTIEGLWRHCLEDGFWPPVVSGTMFPTIGGALAMNIHGKNNFCAGTLGEHVTELLVMDSAGKTHTLKPDDPRFKGIISGAGLLGVILEVKLQMKHVASGNLKVLGLCVKSLEEQFANFEKFEGNGDYMVAWIDCFARGRGLGRGEMHVGWYTDQGGLQSLSPSAQDLPDTIILGIPKSFVWRFLRVFNRPKCMRFVNWAKFVACKILGDGKTKLQGLVGFSFLLDYVPNWRWAYLPGGFIQYQSFVPKEQAKRVFQAQIEMQQAAGLVSFLGVMKRHRPDSFLFSHGVDGYSFAMDFKVTRANQERVFALAHRMNDLVLDAGGRFYFAKDSTLRPSDVERYLGTDVLAKFQELRATMDPDNLFTSELARRLNLTNSS